MVHRTRNMSLVVINVSLESLCEDFIFAFFLKISKTHFVYVINKSLSGIGDKFNR